MRLLILIIGTLFLLSSFLSKQTQWVAIGDSITYLNDHLHETGNRVTKGYMTVVCEDLPQLKYTNKGYNGWTAQRVAKEIESLNIPKADIYSVFLGTNDWWQGRPIGTLSDYKNNTGSNTFYGSYRIIMDKLHQLNNKAGIILITPMQRVDFVYLFDMKNNAFGSYKDKEGQSLASFAEAIKAIGQHEKVAVIDLYNQATLPLKSLVKFKRVKKPATGEYNDYPYPDFIDLPFNPETDQYPYPPESADMTYDGLHPSDKGNAVIARMISQQLKKMPAIAGRR